MYINVSNKNLAAAPLASRGLFDSKGDDGKKNSINPSQDWNLNYEIA